jgi:type II restriction enzyme
MKANKGEWSEFYVFLKILEDKKLPAADKNLETINNKFFVFKKIIRNELGQKTKTFDLKKSEVCILDSDRNVLKKINDIDLKGKSLEVFKKIKSAKTRTFNLPEAELLLEKLLCTKIKAGGAEKSDVDAVIHDRIANQDEMLGFSVKSMIGSASTLLNPGKTTNFIYEVTGFDKKKINAINAIEGKSKIKDRLKAIFKNGGILEFDKIAKEELAINLRKIDTVFPIFISQMLIDYFSGNGTKITDLISLLDQNQNLKNKFNLSKLDYEYKIKNLLIAIALGMVPSKIWDGFTRANGGYIIVKNSGEVICYHLYNRDEFLAYLYENTKFESAGSKRYDYGKIYQENEKMYFKLCLQIRFLK